MIANHTPAPWIVAKESELQMSDGVILESPNGFEIRPDGDQKLGDETADLQLAAAAPELLEALSTLLDEGEFTDYPNTRQWYAVNAARQAIAKATGETP